MANDAKNDALRTLRGILAANEGKAKMFGLVETLKAVDAVLCEQARRQRYLANAICAIAAQVDPKGQRMFNGVLGDDLAKKVAEIFHAGEGL